MPAYSPPTEKYRGVSGMIRSLRVSDTLGQLPDVLDAVELEK
jgi:hypothetical protein